MPATPSALPPTLQAMLNRQIERTLQGRDRQDPNSVRSRYIYSSFLFAPGLGNPVPAGDYDVFVNVRGDANAQGYQSQLTDVETNWEGKGGDVPDWQNLLAWEIFCDICRPPTDTTCYLAAVLPDPSGPVDGRVDLSVPLNAYDVANICDNIVLQVNRGPQNSEPIGYLRDFPAPGGVFGGTQASRQVPQAAVGLSGTPTGATARAYLPITRNAVPVGMGRRFKVPRMIARQSKFSMRLKVPAAFTLLGRNGAVPENNDATGAFVVTVGLWATESFPAD